MNDNWLIVPEKSPCPCGSGKEFGKCHLKNGRIVFNSKNIFPSGPKTGLQNRKCILKSNFNCDNKTSGEHFISASILRAISKDRILITGNNFSRESSINGDSLKTKILCKRHNSAFSPLDTEAGRFIRSYQSIDTSLSTDVENPQKLFLFHGTDIEKWLLKALFAAYYGKISNICLPDYQINTNLMNLFYDNKWPENYGLFVRFKSSSNSLLKMPYENNTSIALHSIDNNVAGISINLLGLTLTLSVDNRLINYPDFSSQYLYRPSYLNYFQGKKVRSIGFVWDNYTGKTIWISRGDPNAQPPKGIFEE